MTTPPNLADRDERIDVWPAQKMADLVALLGTDAALPIVHASPLPLQGYLNHDEYYLRLTYRQYMLLIAFIQAHDAPSQE